MKQNIKKILRENNDPTITCEKCGWDWKKSESGPDMYFCHKCGHDNTPNNINEAAKQMADLPEDASLFVKDNGKWISFILYSKSEDKVYGVITTSDINDSNKLQEVARVAAEKGFGPLMYEIAMGYINPGFLMPSRDGDVKSEAWEVWKRFYERKDVVKKTVPIEDDLFNFAIITGNEHEEFESLEEKKEMFDDLSRVDKKNILVFNTMYQFKNPMILKLIYRADEQLKNKEVNITTIAKAANQFFLGKYD